MKYQSLSFLGAAVLITVFLFMFLLNSLMPLHRDDYAYSLIWDSSVPIESLRDVFQSLWIHYFTHGGRMVSFFILDNFLRWEKIWFNIANAAIFALLALLLFFHGKRRVGFKKDESFLMLTAFFMWIGFPHFGEVAVWACGSVVYLWTGFFVALFLLPYNLRLARPFTNHRPPIFLSFFLGLLAGWSVENLSVTALTIAAVTSFWIWQKGAREYWMPAGVLGSLLGLIALAAAPGNYTRYEAQGATKGFFIHIGNQFAGNGEMLLYILPILLTLLLAWRLLLRKEAIARGLLFSTPSFRVTVWQYAALGILIMLLFSYFTDNRIERVLGDFLTYSVLPTWGYTDAKTVNHALNLTKGLEEMSIYLLSVSLAYNAVAQALGLTPSENKPAHRLISMQELLQIYPNLRYAAVLLGLALYNNAVMLAAPTFPARATFGSVCFIIVSAVSIIRIPAVTVSFSSGTAGRILRIGAIGLGLFLAVSSVLISQTIYLENERRISYIASQSGSDKIIVLPPLDLQNRALRHVFYVDFHNGTTKTPVCKYFGIKDIVIQKNAPLP